MYTNFNGNSKSMNIFISLQINVQKKRLKLLASKSVILHTKIKILMAFLNRTLCVYSIFDIIEISKLPRMPVRFDVKMRSGGGCCSFVN